MQPDLGLVDIPSVLVRASAQRQLSVNYSLLICCYPVLTMIFIICCDCSYTNHTFLIRQEILENEKQENLW